MEKNNQKEIGLLIKEMQREANEIASSFHYAVDLLLPEERRLETLIICDEQGAGDEDRLDKVTLLIEELGIEEKYLIDMANEEFDYEGLVDFE